MTTFHDFEMKTIDGDLKRLAHYKGKVLLVVNVASQCGLTPQYAGLEMLYRQLKNKDFEILGFPCNDFGAQEPGTEQEIKEFCSTRYNVTFPMFSKIQVKGAGQAPVYRWLTGETTSPDGPGDIAWNFAKFLIGKDGRVIARFSPSADPTSSEVRDRIEAALASDR